MTPEFWKALHIISMATEVEPAQRNKEVYEQFFTNLCNLYPDFKEFHTYVPVSQNIDNNRTLFNWTVGLQNFVENTCVSSEDLAKHYYDKIVPALGGTDNAKNFFRLFSKND